MEKTLMLGKIEGGRRRGRQRMRWLDGITDSMGKFMSIELVMLFNHLILCFPLHILTAAAAAAKSLQSCPTLCNPIDGSPSGSSVPGILQERTLEWVAISFSTA